MLQLYLYRKGYSDYNPIEATNENTNNNEENTDTNTDNTNENTNKETTPVDVGTDDDPVIDNGGNETADDNDNEEKKKKKKKDKEKKENTDNKKEEKNKKDKPENKKKDKSDSKKKKSDNNEKKQNEDNNNESNYESYNPVHENSGSAAENEIYDDTEFLYVTENATYDEAYTPYNWDSFSANALYSYLNENNIEYAGDIFTYDEKGNIVNWGVGGNNCDCIKRFARAYAYEFANRTYEFYLYNTDVHGEGNYSSYVIDGYGNKSHRDSSDIENAKKDAWNHAWQYGYIYAMNLSFERSNCSDNNGLNCPYCNLSGYDDIIDDVDANLINYVVIDNKFNVVYDSNDNNTCDDDDCMECGDEHCNLCFKRKAMYDNNKIDICTVKVYMDDLEYLMQISNISE